MTINEDAKIRMSRVFIPPFSEPVALASSELPALKNAVNASSLSTKYHALLPAIYFAEPDTTLIPEDDIFKFLSYDLNVKKLNYIHKQLWLADRPMNYKPLHRQKIMNREIIIIEQIDLHLT